MAHTDNRTLSQDMVRQILLHNYNIVCEIYLKYVYDNYTYLAGYNPIRKEKTRKRVKLDFHSEGYDKRKAQVIAKEIVEEHG